MKVKYEFKEFQNKYKSYRLDNQVKLPQMRYYEDQEQFILLFRDKEGVDLYTIAKVQDIIDFGLLYDVDVDKAIEDFRINYLTAAEQIFNNPFYEEDLMYITEDKSFKKSEDIDPGNDVIDESKDYAGFISDTIKSWENKVMNAIDKIDKSYTNKTFGEFLSGIMNTVNSMPFMGKIRKYIKDSMLAGIDAAENETGIQVGFSIESNDKVKALEHQQLNGYTLPDGKKWYGIKGATQEMQFNILKTVEEGVQSKKTKKEIKDDIKKIFKTASDSQADRLARTETTRFINEGKLTAYKESGLDGYKVWVSVNDNTTSPICKRLHGTRAGFDEPFIDPKTKVAYQYPPSHPNCRSVIEYAQK